MDPDPDPAIFAIDLQEASKANLKKRVTVFGLLLFEEGTFTSFFKKKSQNSRNQGFSYFFA
jgi:hypothetical protein